MFLSRSHTRPSSRKTSKTRRRGLSLESLEPRLALAVAITTSSAGDALILTGDVDLDSGSFLRNDDISISFSNGTFTIFGNGGTTLTGLGVNDNGTRADIPRVGAQATINSIQVALLTGNDTITLDPLPVPINVLGGENESEFDIRVYDGRDPEISTSFVPGVAFVPFGDLLVVNDATAPVLNASYVISGSQILRNGTPIVTYAEIERLSLATAAGNNDVTANLAEKALPAIVRVNASSGDATPLDNRFRVEGSAANDNISIGDINLIPNDGYVPSHFELLGFQRLWVRGQGGDDVIDNRSSVPGLLEGGTGNDTLNSFVSHTSQLLLNFANPSSTTIRDVNLLLGGPGSDLLFAGTSDGFSSQISFLIGDYVPGRQQSNGTFTSFDQALSHGDTYTSYSEFVEHGLVAVGDDAAPQGRFKYIASNINFLLKQLAGDSRFIYPSDFNPLVKQLIEYTRPTTPSRAAPVINRLLDVTQDGAVSAADALAIVNDLNAFGSRPIDGSLTGGEGEAGAASANAALDVNGDRFVSPADVLEVINAINAGLTGASQGSGEGGEGEAAVGAAGDDDLLGLLAVDWAFAARRRK